MLNFRLMSAWQNWAIVFLMFAIGAVGVHLIAERLEN